MMNIISRKTYTALAIIVLLSIGIGAFMLIEHDSKGNNETEEQSKPYIFFTAYRGEKGNTYNPDKTIELWLASTNPDSILQLPQYIEPGKYAFDLLPSEERFYLGYSQQSGEYLDVESLGSQYTWGSLQTSPQSDKLLWVEYAMFFYPSVNWPAGGIYKILLWKNAEREKEIIFELPFHIQFYESQRLWDVIWSPNGQFVSFIIFGKESGFDHLRAIDINTREITNLGENVSSYLWSPNGKYIAFNTYRSTNQNFIIVNTSGNQIFSTGEIFSRIYSYSWSPNEKKIIFTALDEDGKSNAYLVNVKRKKIKEMFELPNTNYHLSNVSWSPDGRYVAFKTSNEEDNNGQLYIADAKKLDSPQLVENISVFGVTPHQWTWGKMEWSQDGKVLAINGIIEDKAGIHFIKPEDGELVGSYYPDTFTREWVFTENNSTIFALLRSEDYACPKEEIDRFVYYNWQEDSTQQFKFNGILETYLKECELTISNFIYGVDSSLEFGYD